MTEVVIVGIGQTSVGEHWDVSIRELALYAIEAAVQDAGGLRPQVMYVGNMLAPILSRQSHLATLLADFAGLSGIETATVEAAGASGGLALRQGYLAILSGLVDVALVVGVEKVTDQVGPAVLSALSTPMDGDYEAEHGVTPPAQAAMLMQRYCHEFNVPREAFAGFPIIAHANGATNSHAMFQREIKKETYLKASMVSYPLNMFDVAPVADGAAAVVLSRREVVPEPDDFPHVRVAGSSVVTDTLALHDRPDPLAFQAARTSVEQVYQQAKISSGEVDFFELFDAFSIFAALSLETAGFARHGAGWQLAQNGAISLRGRLPVATFGGLKARGNPGGATGVYQVVEATLQLRGLAGDNQVPGATRGLVQSLGGPASTVVTHLLERVQDE